MHGVAERVEDRRDLVGDVVGDGDDVALGDGEVFREGAGAVHPDPEGVAAEMPAPGAAVAAEAADDVPLARDAVADPKRVTAAPVAAMRPTNSWPTTIGTGTVAAAQASQFQMCTSVPQIALLSTAISTSFGPGSGTGTSCMAEAGLGPCLDQRAHAGGHATTPSARPDFGEGGDRRRDVFGRMGGGHLGADARLAARNHREGEAGDVDAAREHRLGEVLGQAGVAEHHRDDRVAGAGEGEAERRHVAAEGGGVRVEPGAELGPGLDQVERRRARRRRSSARACWRRGRGASAGAASRSPRAARWCSRPRRRRAPCRGCRSGCRRGPRPRRARACRARSPRRSRRRGCRRP